ncbi:MAG: DMT family transporter [Gammaproteobacteria bacterium]|nr:DMT family transporter [Gammaproteobacteria bacterium]
MTAPSVAPDAPGLGLYARLLAVPAIWGGTFIAGRIVATALPPATASVLRYLVASAALLAFVLIGRQRLPRLTLPQAGATLLLGATGVFAYNLFFMGALAELTASRTSLIIALNPIVTISVAALVFGDRLTPRRWLGVFIALFGVWIVVARGEVLSSVTTAVGRGELLMFGGVCAWVTYTLLGRRVLTGLSAFAATTYAALWGTLLLALGAAPELRRVELAALDPAVIGSLVYLGVVGTAIAFVWYYEAVRVLGTSIPIMFTNLVPVFGAAFGVILLGEPLLGSMLLGGAIAITGVMMVTRN